jgi:hypothetical protein
VHLIAHQGAELLKSAAQEFAKGIFGFLGGAAAAYLLHLWVHQ